jgi:hypothetical protein
MPSSLPANISHRRKWEQITDPNGVLNRDDLVWLLEYVKVKVAEPDPELLKLPPQRLLRNFRAYAELALLLVHGARIHHDQGTDGIKQWIKEAGYGLHHDGH